jgi:flagellar hook-associated protein 3 FlgL
MMQVSTKLFYDRSTSAMSLLSVRADTLQTQIATGKRLATASDDAVAFTRLSGIARANADADVSLANLDVAASVLAQADATLGTIGSQLTRARELTIQARGVLDDTARQAIAAELDAIVAQLVTLGNSTDPRGQPLFGGGGGEAAVTPDGAGGYTFAATLPSAIPTSDGQSVQPGETAARLFARTGGDTLSDIATLATALRTNTGVDAAAVATGDALAGGATQVLTVRTSLGARAQRVEVEQAMLQQTGIDREAVRSGLEDTDITAAITELQKTMTILSATQASFTKLQGLSLFEYLR